MINMLTEFYDIALCEGEILTDDTVICSLRDKCHRYLAMKKLLSSNYNIEYQTFIDIKDAMFTKDILENGKCKAFWEEDINRNRTLLYEQHK